MSEKHHHKGKLFGANIAPEDKAKVEQRRYIERQLSLRDMGAKQIAEFMWEEKDPETGEHTYRHLIPSSTLDAFTDLVRKDMERIWAGLTTDEAVKGGPRAVEQYIAEQRAVKREAWAQYQDAPPTMKNSFLKTVMECSKNIAKVQNVQVDGTKDGKPAGAEDEWELVATDTGQIERRPKGDPN